MVSRFRFLGFRVYRTHDVLGAGCGAFGAGMSIGLRP